MIPVSMFSTQTHCFDIVIMQIQDDNNVDEAKKGQDNVVASADGE